MKISFRVLALSTFLVLSLWPKGSQGQTHEEQAIQHFKQALVLHREDKCPNDECGPDYHDDYDAMQDLALSTDLLLVMGGAGAFSLTLHTGPAAAGADTGVRCCADSQ